MWILLFLTAFGKGGVNIPGTGSFNNCQKQDTKSRQGYSTSPAAILPVQTGKHAAAPTSLVDGENESVDEIPRALARSR